MDNFVNPDAATNGRIPPHARPETAVGMSEESPDRLGAGLADDFDEFHPEQYTPCRDVLAGEDLVFVVPAAEVRLDDPAFSFLARKGCPAVRRCVESLDLVRVVGKELSQGAPIIAIRLLHEASHKAEDVYVQRWSRCCTLHENLPRTYDRELFAEKCNIVFESILTYASQGLKWAA